MPNYDPYEQSRAAIERRRRMAEALQAQSMDPFEQQTAGGYVVPISPTQGLAKLAKAYAGAKLGKTADTEEKALTEERQRKRAEALGKVLSGKTTDYSALVNSDDPELQNLGLELSVKASERARERQEKTRTQMSPDEVVAAGYPQGSIVYKDSLGNVEVGYKPEQAMPEDVFQQKLRLEQAKSAMDPYQAGNLAQTQYQNALNAYMQGVGPNPGPPPQMGAQQAPPQAPQPPPQAASEQPQPQSMGAPAIQSMPQGGPTGQQMPLNPKTQQEIMAEREKARPQAENAVAASTANLDRLAQTASGILNAPGLGRITGATGAVPDLPGSEAADARAGLNTLKSQIFVNVLQAMREASKTGGAVGNVSNMEGARFENNIAALETAQSEPALRKALQDIIQYAQEAKGRIQQAYASEYGGAQQPSAGIDDLLKKYGNTTGP